MHFDPWIGLLLGIAPYLVGLALPVAVLTAVDLVRRPTPVHVAWHGVALGSALAVHLSGADAVVALQPSPEIAVVRSLFDLMAASCLLAAFGLAVARSLQPGDPGTTSRWSVPRLLLALVAAGPLGVAAADLARTEATDRLLLGTVALAVWALPLLARTGGERLDRGRAGVATLAIAAGGWMVLELAHPLRAQLLGHGAIPGLVLATSTALVLVAAPSARTGLGAEGVGALALHGVVGLLAVAGGGAILREAGERLSSHPIAALQVPWGVDLLGRRSPVPRNVIDDSPCFATIDRDGRIHEHGCQLRRWALDASSPWPDIDALRRFPAVLVVEPVSWLAPTVRRYFVAPLEHRRAETPHLISITLGSADGGARAQVAVRRWRSLRNTVTVYEVAYGPPLHRLFEQVVEPEQELVVVPKGWSVQEAVSICLSALAVAGRNVGCYPAP